ncbi:hypothetical protein KFU94_16840 [Chloroflexi bacterium TSY]|nr:hypothetical protein [Chloroflexi bacterium TSY]
MVVKTEIRPPVDEFSETYAEYIEGQYDCVDRIVLNAYWSMGQNGGGFRVWWRSWQGSDDGLNTARLMRFAREYARRLRAYAEAEGIPVIDCESGVRKHELAETYIPDDPAFVGVFAILVSKFSAPTWHVKESKDKKRIHLEEVSFCQAVLVSYHGPVVGPYHDPTQPTSPVWGADILERA